MAYFSSQKAINRVKVICGLTLIVTTALLAASQITLPGKASAAAFTNSHFIDNVLLLNANAMNTDAIQSFLNTKSGVLKNSSFLMDCDAAGATAKQMYLSISAPCGQTISAARIIFYSSQIYGINPQAVISTLQKEQGLITDPSPTTRAINQAMGFACPDSGGCSASSNFFYQIDNGAWALRYHYERANGNNTWWNTRSWTCGTAKRYYVPNLYPGQNISFYDDNSTLYATVYVENAATSSLYCYTPHAYNNPQGLYGRSAFGTTGMYYSGSYNFVYYYELWFGSTYAYAYNGTNYKDVFDPAYYAANNPDVANAVGNGSIALFDHFVRYGMSEGRQASANFNVNSYLRIYPDLRNAFRWNLPAYYAHYEQWGMAQGRTATGNYLGGTTSYNGTDYSAVYNFDYYSNTYPDIANTFGLNDAAALQHFVQRGMSEGRQASANFNVINYRNRYPDLRWSPGFGWNLPSYYVHYVRSGKSEGRIANTSGPVQYLTSFNGIDYASVYDFTTYQTINTDIKNAFGDNDYATLQHFVQRGMSEGRRANNSFTIQNYVNRYADLRSIFGWNLPAYYVHYIMYGKSEGRIGT